MAISGHQPLRDHRDTWLSWQAARAVEVPAVEVPTVLLATNVRSICELFVVNFAGSPVPCRAATREMEGGEGVPWRGNPRHAHI